MSDGGQQASPAGGDPVDLSPGVTTMVFDPIVSPLRIPVPAGVNDDPSKGEWLLAFKDDASWRRGWQMCHKKISEQCEMGARMGCSITAANACRIPWWKQALIFIKVAKLGEGEREACEDREMMACLAGTKETCNKYARDTCDPVFAGARIAESHVCLDPRFTGTPHRRMLGKHAKLENENLFEAMNPDALLANRPREGSESSESNFTNLATNYRGRRLMDRESSQRSWDGPDWSERAEKGGISTEAEAHLDGWEGGLIRPKLDSQKKQSGDISAPNVRTEEPIWQAVGHRVRSLRK